MYSYIKVTGCLSVCLSVCLSIGMISLTTEPILVPLSNALGKVYTIFEEGTSTFPRQIAPIKKDPLKSRASSYIFLK